MKPRKFAFSHADLLGLVGDYLRDSIPDLAGYRFTSVLRGSNECVVELTAELPREGGFFGVEIEEDSVKNSDTHEALVRALVDSFVVKNPRRRPPCWAGPLPRG